MQKKLLYLFFISSFITLKAQDKYLFSGKILNQTSTIKEAHIINLKTKQGTFSNEFGEYQIYASLGDSLKISSVQFSTTIRMITKHDLKNKIIDIQLKEKTYVLEEIVLKKHNLKGSLISDIKKVPEDKNKKTSNDFNNYFQSLSFNSIINMPNENRPSVKNLSKISIQSTDPTTKFAGLTSSGFASKKNKKPLPKITDSLFSSKTIIDLVGIPFFTELKIKKEDINSFIDFCEKFNIEALYNQGKILQLIKILEEKSNTYLKE